MLNNFEKENKELDDLQEIIDRLIEEKPKDLTELENCVTEHGRLVRELNKKLLRNI